MLLISLVYSPVHADEVKEVYLTFDDGLSRPILTSSIRYSR